MKTRELGRRDEINKRIALAEESSSTFSTLNKKVGLVSKPLTQQTREAASKIFYDESSNGGSVDKNRDRALNVESAMNLVSNFGQKKQCDTSVAASESVLAEQRERELKFIAAGWKRDFHGKWHKDENVEFDSDEEDPNVALG